MKMIDDPHIDSAINSYELVRLPKGFTQRTMQRIRAEEKIQPVFRLHFLDIALPVFGMAFWGAILLVGSYMLNSLNPSWLQDFQGATASLLSNIGQSLTLILGGAGLVGLSVFLLFLLLVVVVSSRPFVQLKL